MRELRRNADLLICNLGIFLQPLKRIVSPLFTVETKQMKIGMNAKQVFLTAALAACTFAASAQTVIDSGYCGAQGNNLTWVLTSDSVLSIYGSGDMEEDCFPTPWNSYIVKIKEVIIGDSINSIGGRAFRYCSNLTLARIGHNVTRINVGAFNSTALTSIIIPNKVINIEDHAFSNCFYLTSVTMGNNLIHIGENAFSQCTRLISITIPDNVTIIGGFAFYNCTNLTSITMGKNLKEIGGYAFHNCVSLTSVTISNSVSKIWYYAFYNCANLTSVIIGDSVTKIYAGAFEDCVKLTSLTLRAIMPPILDTLVFHNVPNTASVFVPCGAIPTYQADSKWNYFTNFQDTVPIKQPDNLVIVRQNNKLVISWKQTNVTNYEIYRNGEFLDTVDTNIYIDSNLTYNIAYCYQVKAIDGDCESLLSDTACFFNNVGVAKNTNEELQVINHEIYNILGQLLLSNKFLPSFEILPTGIYIIKTYTNQGIKLNKLIINKFLET